MEPAINWPHLAICLLPFCLVASKAEGVKLLVPLSPDSHHHSLLKLSFFHRGWHQISHPHCCVSTALVSLDGSSWEMKAQPVLPSDLTSVGCTKPDAGPHSYCSQRKATKSYSLFDPPSTWFSIRSQCQLLPVKRWENQQLLKKISEHLQGFSGEQQKLQEKQVWFLVYKIELDSMSNLFNISMTRKIS